ncbi:hypothetical protein GCM10022295_91600 [Streptomyces osmaniensis]|uniref:Secreted protein n=1 Tax=Streptomyces osmaniensis TaxID=593134 RepID=A0ABP6Z3R1_9ACTN
MTPGRLWWLAIASPEVFRASLSVLFCRQPLAGWVSLADSHAHRGQLKCPVTYLFPNPKHAVEVAAIRQAD